MAGSAPEFWQARGLRARLLLPLSSLFAALSFLRRLLYRAGILTVHRAPRPVVVVGNIAVGGSGKTPVVAWLCERFREAGHEPGILSRGYGGQLEGVAQVPVEGADPLVYGDEPVLLAALTKAPVFVGRDRVAAARALVAACPECTVLISDDGLQHYAMAREVEVIVLDQAVLGNRYRLPSGPLREGPERLAEADLLLRHGPMDERLRHACGQVAVFAMTLLPSDLYALDGSARHLALARLRGKRVHAVAGIGRPERFFDTLREAGLEPICHAFPDHHRFEAGDLRFDDAYPVLMTAKDAVKCASFAPPDAWVLPVAAQIDPGAFRIVMEKLGHGQSSA